MKNFDFNLFYTVNPTTGEYLPTTPLGTFQQKEYRKGEYIAMKGERVNELSIVVKGSVTVSFVIDSGMIIRSVKHPAPTLVGAMAILTNDGRYIADTIANEDVTTLSYSRKQIEQEMAASTKFMYNFISFITSRVDNLKTHIAVLAQKNIKAKLAYYILLNSRNKRYCFNRKVSSLAEYLCVERPSLSRAISQMTKEKLITYSAGEGEILNEEELKALIE